LDSNWGGAKFAGGVQRQSRHFNSRHVRNRTKVGPISTKQIVPNLYNLELRCADLCQLIVLNSHISRAYAALEARPLITFGLNISKASVIELGSSVQSQNRFSGIENLRVWVL
jgi:hypothetical protein